MFENIIKFFKKIGKKEEKKETGNSKDAAKERLHLVLMQDRANVSTDFLELMKQEIIEVIKKYIEVDESAIDVRLTNKENEDGTNGAPALYANIPILNIKKETTKKEKENVEENVSGETKEKIENKDKLEEEKNEPKGQVEEIEILEDREKEEIKEKENLEEENENQNGEEKLKQQEKEKEKQQEEEKVKQK